MSKGPVLIAGATSGIARAISNELAKEGHPIVLAGRDESELQRLASDLSIRTGTEVHTALFDASDPATHPLLLMEASAKAGKLEGAVLAFGYLGDQQLAQTDWQEARKILELNFVSAASLLHVLASDMETRQTGWITVLSSVAGDRGRMSNYVYGSAKGGLTVFLQGLRARLQKSGVHVMTVKPGPVDTAMTFGSDKLPLLADPGDVGAAIVKALKRRKDVVYVPSPWRLIMFVLRTVPEKVFKKTSL
ncbi:MAG: SDR family oxidoreductase [Armatimonadetes bacterium]|nr:SDR family oxidoreductase [Armatimonadota bacterium]